MNIKFNYLYRDAGNYKINGSIIFPNPENLSVIELEKEIRSCLIDSEFFDPHDFYIPKLELSDFPYDSELDHSWHEFDSIEETDDVTTDNRSIQGFIALATKIKKSNLT